MPILPPISKTLCLPLQGYNSLAECKQKIAEHAEQFEYFELWLDYYKDLALVELRELEALYPNRLILLFRRLKLEKPSLPEDKALFYVRELAAHRLWFDFDLQAQQSLLLQTFKYNPKIIFSYHNYQTTPDQENILKILKEMKALSTRARESIFKIACSCEDPQHQQTLLSILADIKAKKDDAKYCILGMGELGKLIRERAAREINFINFAILDQRQATAPGQLTRDELLCLIKP